MKWKDRLRVMLGIGVVLFLLLFMVSLYVNMFTMSLILFYNVVKVFCGLYFGGLFIYGLIVLINWCFKPLEK